MNKKLIKAIIPLCIFILFISIFIQKPNYKYKDEEVIETMAKNEEKKTLKMIIQKISLKLIIVKLPGI